MSKKFLNHRPTLAERRLLLPNHEYHLFSHAVKGLRPFATDELKQAWFDTMRRRLPGAPIRSDGPEVFDDISVLAVAVMDNHPHIVAGQGDDRMALSRFFGNCLRAFALRYNHLTGHKGQVFVKPYDLRVLKDRAALRRAIAYVHRNPKRLESINRFTSHPQYLNEDASTFVRADFGLKAFGGRDAYVEYFDRYCRQKHSEESP
jgi:hypothetical protein